MDYTQIIVSVIGLIAVVVSGFGGYVIRKYINPWLKEHRLEAAAEIVVNAVEALLGRYLGEEKWELALEKMKERGWDIDSEEVLDALRSAWENLNLKQIEAGVKYPDEDEMEEEDEEVEVPPTDE